jgi:hypothetical protein
VLGNEFEEGDAETLLPGSLDVGCGTKTRTNQTNIREGEGGIGITGMPKAAERPGIRPEKLA